jgi:RNA polymerase sigma-70 factor (ECF subfamily)
LSAKTDAKTHQRIAEFVRLTQPHHQQLYGVALSLCRDKDQAHDLTQEALVRAFEAFDQFRQGAPIWPWLRRILRNLFLDTFKTGRAQHEIGEREMSARDPSPLLTRADDSPDVLTQMERSQLSLWLQEEIASLAPSQKQVLELCVMQGLSFEEAAEVAGIPVGTIASRLARARAELRARMLKRTTIEHPPEAKQAQLLSMDEKKAPSRKGLEAPKECSNDVQQEGPKGREGERKGKGGEGSLNRS